MAGGLLVARPLAAHGMHEHGGQLVYLGFLQGVTLTDAQRSRMHDLMHASMQKMRPEWHELHVLHEQNSDELASTATVAPAPLAAQQRQAEALQAQLDQARLSTALQVRQLLTSDQLS